MTFLERIHLEIIRAIDKHGTMTAAAAELNLTQSALSHSMRKLEDQLNVTLWHREGHRLRPTQAGEYVLKTAHRLIPQFNRTEEVLQQYARGELGTLRIGMECHPCYRWLQKVSAPYLRAWPLVDLDVRQEFMFGGIGALFTYEIDMLVTPDPLQRKSLFFEPVFDYEQVLVVGPDHPLRHAEYAIPRQLGDETLFTYPVPKDRLDVYTHFLTPARATVRRQKEIETTDMLFQMVACGRGVAALPRWLVEEYAATYPVSAVRLGRKGVRKQIFLGLRESEREVPYIRAFLHMARDYRDQYETTAGAIPCP